MVNQVNLVKGKCYQKINGDYLGGYYGIIGNKHLFTYATLSKQNSLDNLVIVPCKTNHAQVTAGGKTRRKRSGAKRKTRKGANLRKRE